MSSGATVITTRPAGQSGAFERALRRLPVTAVECPLTEIVFLQRPPDAAGTPADWIILTSASSVEALRRDPEGCRMLSAGSKVAAVGPRTADRWRQLSGTLPDVISPEGTGRSLGAALRGQLLPGQRVVVPGAREMQTGLFEELAQVGVTATHLVLYETRELPVAAATVEHIAALNPARLLFCFFSPSAVRSALRSSRFEEAMRNASNLAIGPSTAAPLREAALPLLVAERHTGQGMVREVIAWLRKEGV